MLHEFLTVIRKIGIGIIIFTVSLLTTIFILKNNMPVTLNLGILGGAGHNLIFKIPLWLYSIYMLILGASISGGIMWWNLSTLKEEMLAEQKKKANLEKDLNALKENITKTVA